VNRSQNEWLEPMILPNGTFKLPYTDQQDDLPAVYNYCPCPKPATFRSLEVYKEESRREEDVFRESSTETRAYPKCSYITCG